MSEENIERQLLEPWVMFDSDAAAGNPAECTNLRDGHPRALGNVTGLLGHYVRERGLSSLEEAVRRLTSLPARHLGLGGRGELRAGFYADVVTFSPATVRDRATYREPAQLPEGVRDVWVNGVRVLRAAG